MIDKYPINTFDGETRKEIEEFIESNYISKKEFEHTWKQEIVEYVEKNFPKGIDKDRGKMTTHITIFMCELTKRLNEN